MPLFASKEKSVLEELVGRTPTGKRWVMLLTSAPTKGMSLAEVEALRCTYGGYADTETPGTASWDAATGEAPAEEKNTGTITFPEWTSGADQKATYFAVREAAALVGYEKLEAPVTIGAGNKVASFAAKALSLTIT
jgi:hypothetical protein